MSLLVCVLCVCLCVSHANYFAEAERMIYFPGTIEVGEYLHILVGQDTLHYVALVWD